jgi:2-keto-4-pentenoate hydratase
MTTRGDLVRELAAKLRLAEELGMPTAPIFDRGNQDLSLAYAVQRENIGHWTAEGRRLVGRKIGLADMLVQQQLGIAAPICGALFADMAVANGGTAEVAHVMAAEVEPEVALVIAREITTPSPTVDEVTGAVAFAMPALEIIGSRYFPGEATVADDVADNGGSGLFVAGHALPGSLTTHSVMTTVIQRDREPPSEIGKVSVDWNRILTATAWLVVAMRAEGTPLRAGDIVLTGAVNSATAVRAGDRITATIDGHAAVSVSFVAGKLNRGSRNAYREAAYETQTQSRIPRNGTDGRADGSQSPEGES